MVRPIDRFWIALFALAGIVLIFGSVWQLFTIAAGSAPARVYRDEFVHGFYILKGIFGTVLGLVNLALARIHFIRRSYRSAEPQNR
jgi:hypothetical protein